jgi:DNA processing protein
MSVGLPSDDDPALVDELLLTLVPGVGPRTRQTLIGCFGSASAALDAPPSALREAPGVGPKLTRAISSARTTIDVQTLLNDAREHQVSILVQGRPGYPASLLETPDPPGVLFVRGALVPRDMLGVAIVGSRHATHYGLKIARQLASGLARAGFTIVSGLARGIDGAAHQGALEAGGRTLAVLGSGVMNIYPPEHETLAEQVIRNGALISEAPLRAAPTTGSFPQRNRLISGLTLGAIVVEAADRSGALITARHAMEQGREVFAVPGRVDDRMSRGCHRLIRDGATLVETVDDVLEQLGPLACGAETATGEEIRHPAELSLNEVEQAVLAAIETHATSIDLIVGRSHLPAAQVLATLSVLEVKRLIRRVSGSLVMRA